MSSDYEGGGASLDPGGSATEVTQESWLGRLGNAIKGVLIGMLLFIVGFPVLWFNEGLAVHTAQGLRELSGSVVSVAADKVDVANDGRPVHMTGDATTDETLRDPMFPVAAAAVKLRRTVEMYQWKEKKSSETRRKFGGGTETVTTYTYNNEWSSELVNSHGFHEAVQHVNPAAKRIPDATETASTVKLGAFRLSPGLLEQMKAYERLPTEGLADKLPADLRKQAKVDGGYVYLANDPQQSVPEPLTPRVGDLRITFDVVKPAMVSILAAQSGDTFAAWQAHSGTSVERLMPGRLEAAAMIGKLQEENNVRTWVLRLVGFLLMAIGLALVAAPLAVLGDVIPLVGGLLRAGTAFFAILAAGCLSLVTIAVAWLAYRPLWGAGLLVIAGGLLLALKLVGSSRTAAV